MMIRLGLVGIGKIARDQHLPAIRADDRYELVATASRHAQVDGVPGHADIAAMIAGDYRLGAVSICTRSEEHTSELQSLVRISYAVICLKKKKKKKHNESETRLQHHIQ